MKLCCVLVFEKTWREKDWWRTDRGPVVIHGPLCPPSAASEIRSNQHQAWGPAFLSSSHPHLHTTDWWLKRPSFSVPASICAPLLSQQGRDQSRRRMSLGKTWEKRDSVYKHCAQTGLFNLVWQQHLRLTTFFSIAENSFWEINLFVCSLQVLGGVLYINHVTLKVLILILLTLRCHWDSSIWSYMSFTWPLMTISWVIPSMSSSDWGTGS